MAISKFRAPAAPDPHCPVCHCSRIRSDSVQDGTLLHIAECPHCEHRWTSRGVELARVRVPRPTTRMRAVKAQEPLAESVSNETAREVTTAA